MKTVSLVALAVMAGALPVLALDLSPFQFRRAVVTAPAASPGTAPSEVAGVALDPDAYAATQAGFRDLRVADDTGTVIPCSVEKITDRKYRTVREAVATHVVALKELPGNRIEVLVALDDKAPAANGFTFHTNLRDYEHSVVVTGSPDGQAWSPLVADAVIFDYTRFMDVENRDVPLPANACRQFRIEVGNIADETASPLTQLTREYRERGGNAEIRSTSMVRRPFRINSVNFWRTVDVEDGRKDLLQPWPIQGFTVSRDPKEKTTTVHITTRREPLTQFTLTTGSRNFSRPVEVEVPYTAEGRTKWRPLVAGTLANIQFQAYRRNDLTITFPEERQTEFRLIIRDADNPPLEIQGVEAAGSLYRALVLAAPQRKYLVYYGSEAVDAPDYDLEAVLAPVRRGLQPLAWTLGPQEPNPEWRQGAGPFWKHLLNNRTFFVGAVIAMVAVLGWGVFHAMKRVEQLPPP